MKRYKPRHRIAKDIEYYGDWGCAILIVLYSIATSALLAILIVIAIAAFGALFVNILNWLMFWR